MPIFIIFLMLDTINVFVAIKIINDYLSSLFVQNVF